MKKLTRNSLDELAKVMPVISENEQRFYVGGNGGEIPSGSHTQPYTWEEYQALIASGNWNGGYIEGYGYVLPDVVVTADGCITSSFHGLSNEFNAVEGDGYTGNFTYRGSYMIENGYMTIGCGIYSRFGNDITASGEVLVYVDGQEVLCQPLSTSSSMVYESGSIPLGTTTFDLQQYTGHVEVKIRMGYSRFDSGYSGISTTETIYSSYR